MPGIQATPLRPLRLSNSRRAFRSTPSPPHSMAYPAIPPFPPTTLSSLRFLPPSHHLQQSRLLQAAFEDAEQLRDLQLGGTCSTRFRPLHPVWELRPALPLQLPVHHFLPHPFSVNALALWGLPTLNLLLRRSPERGLRLASLGVPLCSGNMLFPSLPFSSLLPRSTLQATLHLMQASSPPPPKNLQRPSPLGSSHSRPLPPAPLRLRLSRYEWARVQRSSRPQTEAITRRELRTQIHLAGLTINAVALAVGIYGGQIEATRLASFQGTANPRRRKDGDIPSRSAGLVAIVHIYVGTPKTPPIDFSVPTDRSDHRGFT
ncbi:hypothetical protein DFP72DRAFT_110380 [Ephemerocybe angulata]|uniref:Uncharacterized protein n=1 Tax=Ephemerocybe angulata TaxID=980116 RepID=A0A8H6HCR5_9AGAR|nr:hypothetical protein DFP72DRAFT_110380 [Tulosesus angulatus]